MNNAVSSNNLISSTNFFDQKNVKNFLKNNTKKDILTHLSEILKTVSLNKVQNLEKLCCSKSFSLRNIPQISYEFASKKKTTTNVNIKTLAFQDLKNILHSHQTFDHRKEQTNAENAYECRLLFMTLTGLRIQSTFDLNSNSNFFEKNCKNCKKKDPCLIFNRQCFQTINIKETKTSNHILPLLPNIMPCYHFLKNCDDNSLVNYQQITFEFNKKLKEEYTLTSHSLRKFLPNFFSINSSMSNTGNWTNSNTMKKHYLDKDHKYLLIYQELKNL